MQLTVLQNAITIKLPVDMVKKETWLKKSSSYTNK